MSEVESDPMMAVLQSHDFGTAPSHDGSLGRRGQNQPRWRSRMNGPFLTMSLILLGLHGSTVMSDQTQNATAEGRQESRDAADSKLAGRLILLNESLSPIQDRFNADADRRRLVLILSPT